MFSIMRNISPNRHRWNQRQVETLGKEIDVLERELDASKGLIHKLRIKAKIKALAKRRDKHGEEVMAHELNGNN